MRAKKYLDNLYDTDWKRAQQAFQNHCLRKDYGEGRWLLQRPRTEDGEGWSTFYAAEVVCVYGGRLFVGGDIASVTFAHGPQDPLARLKWIAEQPPASSTVRQKAHVGSGRESVFTWDADYAVEMMQDALTTLDLEEADAECVREAIRGVGDGEAYVWQELPHDAWEYLDGLGKVLDVKVFYAHAAIARLYELLTQESE
jgi:hypothetical protein